MHPATTGPPRSIHISRRRSLRKFSCSENPIDIFDGYVLHCGATIRTARRWYGQGETPGDFLNSKVVVAGAEIDYGDDPRGFVYQGQLCVLSNTFSSSHGFRNHLLVLGLDGEWQRFYLMPPKDVDPGKNWSPCQLPDGTLAFIHSFSQLVVLREVRRERGIILLSASRGVGLSPQEGDGGYAAHRGGTAGVMLPSGDLFGIGHTTRRAYRIDGQPIIDPDCWYPNGHQLIHRPFAWLFSSLRMSLVELPTIFDCDGQYFIVDPTSLIEGTNGTLKLFTTEVQRNYVQPKDRGEICSYEVTFQF